MIKFLGTITELGEKQYLPEPGMGEPDGLWRRKVTFRTNESEECEQDEIAAILWDFNASLNLNVGDEVLVTLQFGVMRMKDGSSYLQADVVEIKRIIELW